MDWPVQIAKALLVKEAVKTADTSGIWPHRLPGVAVDEERLNEVERVLGCKLDKKYRKFLTFADGWHAFYQSVDLFGTSDLVASAGKERAQHLLSSIEDAALQSSKLRRCDLFPIAAAMEDIDVFAICPTGPSAGNVVWFAGCEVDRFSDFDQYFLAMVDYNRRMYERLINLKQDSR